MARHPSKITRAPQGNAPKLERAEIAAIAARLIAEGDAHDFASAKRKAAASIGLENSRNLPDNLTVQAALLEYLRLFEGDVLDARIALMRHEALAAMHVFEIFEPRLAGPVLYGSALAHCAVTLHLHTDEIESVTRFLEDSKIKYQLTETRLKVAAKRYEEFPTFLVSNNDLDFELIVMPLNSLTHPPLSALDGRRYRRVDSVTLKQLMAQSGAVDAPSRRVALDRDD
ncbi:MAG: hypothetical protein O3C28_13300 [Proteobacteria bacterium]|nr:hypothetical protein [Pseudomonadota bacterium]